MSESGQLPVAEKSHVVTVSTSPNRHLRQAGYLTVRIPVALIQSNIAAAVELVRNALPSPRL